MRTAPGGLARRLAQVAALLPLGLGPLTAEAHGMDEAKSIGSATMAADGTIVLDLRAAGPQGLGDARMVYPPGDPNYASVLRHLGGLRPGEEKPVPPWPDEP
ncbi:MAG TPA: hypothetical protein VHD15_08505 [Hyphomicrobiales bacterium]|nr:hypothetical protein [Hyphomicrobiales bacterium]